MTLYKWTDWAGQTYRGFQWPLPRDGQPGDWTPKIEGKVTPCANGYHLCKEEDLISWLNHRLFVAEADGETKRRPGPEGKTVAARARLVRELAWDSRSQRLFACLAAERRLPLFEAARPWDARPREAIATARAYADDAATDDALRAAWRAACAATEEAARAATDPHTLGVWRAALTAAWAATWSAWEAAWNAAQGAFENQGSREWHNRALCFLLEL